MANNLHSLAKTLTRLHKLQQLVPIFCYLSMSQLVALDAVSPERNKEYPIMVFSIISKAKGKTGKSEWIEQFYIANHGAEKAMIAAIDIAVVAGQDPLSNNLKHSGFGVGGTTPNDGSRSAITIGQSMVKLVPTRLHWDNVPVLQSSKNTAKIIDNTGKEIEIKVERFLSG